MKFLIVFFIVFFCAACNPDSKIPDDVIGIDKMKLIMWDMIRAGELARNNAWKDSVTFKTTQSFQQVFSIYSITKDNFYKSYKYYEEHPDQNKILMDSITAYASRKRADLFVKPRVEP